MLLTVKTVYMKKTLFSCCVLIALLWGTTLELIAGEPCVDLAFTPFNSESFGFNGLK